MFDELLRTGFWRARRLPVILQTEAAECGLACICMVASYWGHVSDLATMRGRFTISQKGATLKGIMAIGQALNLHGRPVKLDIHQLHELALPCVLHWDMNHFVVLKSIQKGFAFIHDPAVGLRKLSLQEVSNHFTGVALELTPSKDFEVRRELEAFSLMSLMGPAVGLKQGLAKLAALGLVLQLCSLIAPFYMQWIVDEALVAADANLITVLGLGFVLLVVIQTAVTAVRSWATAVFATHLNVQWLANTFWHLLKLPLPYFERRHTGDVVSRFQSIQTIQHSLTTQFVEGVIDGVLVLGTLTMMFLYSPALAAVALLAVAAYALLRFTLYNGIKNATAEQIIHAAKQQTHFLESVRGMQSIRLFSRMTERHTSWSNLLVDQFNAELRISRFSVTHQAANFFIFNIERVILIWLAALTVLDGRFSVGMMFAFISYKDQFSQRMASLTDKACEFRMLRLHGERVADIVQTKPESQDSLTEFDWTDVLPSIELRDVSFQYADGEPCIVKNLNLVVPAGQCIAITGPSGCGKTTLVKLMVGLLEPSAGEILIGGHRLSHIGVSRFRQMIGTVMQEDSLFAGSIADNICFFDPSPDLTKVQRCAELSAIHAEISSMPMGYNTLIGDIGAGISGGQKQRILLARALYREPSILILDEATSHLDLWNEKNVNASVSALKLTRILIAHRPETVAMADRVVVVQCGNISQDVLQTRLRQAESA